MPRDLPMHVFQISNVTAFADPEDGSSIQISLQTQDTWYQFRLPRASLKLLSRQIEKLLRDEPPEFQT